MNETEFQKQVTDLAEILGYKWAHFRPAKTAHGWRTPVSGPLGKGFPDLVLVGRGRVIFAELKVGRIKPDGAQIQNHAWLVTHGAELYVWRPEDIEAIADTLTGARAERKSV